jgi:hypothetical protein
MLTILWLVRIRPVTTLEFKYPLPRLAARQRRSASVPDGGMHHSAGGWTDVLQGANPCGFAPW